MNKVTPTKVTFLKEKESENQIPKERNELKLDKMKQWEEKYHKMMNAKFHHQIGTSAHFMRMWTTSIRKLREETIEDKQIYIRKLEKYGNIPESTLFEITKERVKPESGQNYTERIKKINLSEIIMQRKTEAEKRLKQLSVEREDKMTKQEENLENKATEFISLINESDTVCSNSIKKANEVSEINVKLTRQIKLLTAEKISLQNSIAKQSTLLKKLIVFRKLLDTLAPKDWSTERERKEKLSETIEETKSNRDINDISEKSAIYVPKELEIENDYEIYFKDPTEVVLRLKDCKDQCISFFRYSLETDEILEETKAIFTNFQENLSNEIESMKREINLLKETEDKHKSKSIKFQQLINKYSYEKEKNFVSKELRMKISELYRCCGNEFSESNEDCQIMLTHIECYLDQLLHNMTLLPSNQLMKIYRMKQKFRRRLEQEKEQEEKKKQQEERMIKVLERAKLAKERKLVRKPMHRSEPFTPETTTKTKTEAERRQKEEFNYFFI